jgi:hypothetical protein
MNNIQKKQLLTAVIAVVVLYFLYKMFMKKSGYTSPNTIISTRLNEPATNGPLGPNDIIKNTSGSYVAVPTSMGVVIGRLIGNKVQTGSSPNLFLSDAGQVFVNDQQVPLRLLQNANGPFELRLNSSGNFELYGGMKKLKPTNTLMATF